jgi:RND superfamily putative drug exporter
LVCSVRLVNENRPVYGVVGITRTPRVRSEATVFARLGETMIRRRWIVIGVWAVIAVIGAGLGGHVFSRAADVPNLGPQSESMIAKARIDQLKPQGPEIDAALLGVAPVDPSISANAMKIDNQIRALPGVLKVDDIYNGHGQVGADNKSAIVRVHLVDHLSKAQQDAVEDNVVTLLHRLQAPQVLVTGDDLAQRAFADQATQDSAKGESIALLVLIVVLLLVFRTAVGAAVPLGVALVVITAGLLGLLVLSYLTDISQFAVNIVTLFGIGLAVDYCGLLLFRFREARIAEPDAPVASLVPGIMATAGRAVLISGAAVAAAMGGLYLFGEPLLAAMALGGFIVVVAATAVALTLVPAVLATWGDRIALPGQHTWVDRLTGPVTRLVRRRQSPTKHGARLAAEKRARDQRSGAQGLLGRLAAFAQRHPAPVAAISAVGLLALTSLFLFANLGNSDARSMPTSMEVRQGYDAVQTEFNNNQPVPVSVVAEISPDRQELKTYLNQLERIPGIHSVTLRPDVPPTATVIDVTTTGDTAGPQSRDLVQTIRALNPPFRFAVGGPAAELVDYQQSVAGHLPIVALVLLLAAGVLLFLLTGSVVVPVKAVLLNLLTLGATLGVLVLTFQWGWGSWLLGFDPWGAIDLTTPLLLFIFVVGLTMDYEVFLLARIKEEWDAHHDNDRAVLRGIGRTSAVVTTAALCIGVVFLGFVLGGLTAVKEVGFGMAIAVFIDVTVIRGLLLPALMALLGDLNWWAPSFLRRRPAPPAEIPVEFAGTT